MKYRLVPSYRLYIKIVLDEFFSHSFFQETPNFSLQNDRPIICDRPKFCCDPSGAAGLIRDKVNNTSLFFILRHQFLLWLFCFLRPWTFLIGSIIKKWDIKI